MTLVARQQEQGRAAPRERLTHVIQGHYAVSENPNEVFSTILGSCVAACVRDPVAGVGGMNHFLLPGDENAGESMKYGVNSMELLINGLLQSGASRARLEAKLFGGAHVVKGLSDIGARNAEFAQRFLIMERIACVGHSLGGDQARRLRYWPTTGRASQLLINDPTRAIFVAEKAAPATPAGDVDFF